MSLQIRFFLNFNSLYVELDRSGGQKPSQATIFFYVDENWVLYEVLHNQQVSVIIQLCLFTVIFLQQSKADC